MGSKYRIFKLSRGGERGKLLSCETCQKLLAVRFPENTSHFYIQTICKCTTTGYIPDDCIPDSSQCLVADFKDNTLFCSQCGKPLLHTTENLDAFAFFITCKCGNSFNKKYRNKRNAYTELLDIMK